MQSLRTIPTMYLNKNKLSMMIPKNIYYGSVKNEVLYEFMSKYTSTMLKISFSESPMYQTYNLVDSEITHIDFRQIMNIPSGEQLYISTNIEDKYSSYIENATKNKECNRILLDNFQVNLNIQNETHEMFGYCNELVHLTFERK